MAQAYIEQIVKSHLVGVIMFLLAISHEGAVPDELGSSGTSNVELAC